MSKPNVILLLVISCSLVGEHCFADAILDEQKETVNETRVQYIALAPPLDRPKAQISGMAWCGNNLLLLPERPWFEIAEDNQDPQHPIETFLYQLNRNQIDNFLSGTQVEPLTAEKIVLQENGVRSKLNSFDGYEAIVCAENKLWLSIETEISEEVYETNIVGATFNDSGEVPTISIDPMTIHRIESQSGMHNYSDETLLLNNINLISIHEANSASPNKLSFATRINFKTGKRDKLPFPTIPFRITDATTVDQEGYFWGINYSWRGERSQFSEQDNIASEYGLGESHKLEENVERLIQFRLSKNVIDRVDLAPIQLKLTQEDGRNWEGIVRYRDKGLLLITDQYPRTLFGFVPFN